MAAPFSGNSCSQASFTEWTSNNVPYTSKTMALMVEFIKTFLLLCRYTRLVQNIEYNRRKEVRHVYSKSIFRQRAIRNLLHDHEGEREHAVRWETLSEPVKRQMNGVVGFRIDITDMQATFKLSQNRNDVDHERIVSELEKQDEPIADVMRRHRKS